MSRSQAHFLDKVNIASGAGNEVLTAQFLVNGLSINNTSNSKFNIYFGEVSLGIGNKIPDFTVPEYTFATIPVSGQSMKITIEWTAPTVVRDNYIRVDLQEDKSTLSYVANPPSTVGTGSVSNVTIVGAMPEGTNHLGTVTIDNPSIQVTVGNEIEIKNDLANPIPVAGTISVSSLPSLAAGTNAIGKVEVTVLPAVNIGTIPEVEIKNDVGNPLIVSPIVGGLIDRSGSITTGGVSQNAVVANVARKYLAIFNIDPTEDLWVNFGVAAAKDTAGSVRLPTGAAMIFEGSFIPTDLVSVVAVTAGHKFTIKEG